MGIADIHVKQSDERKREKKLVHLTNELSRDFINAASSKSRTSTLKKDAEYLVKSFLDYVFFHDHKEIREINEQHVQHFMIEFAPRKINLNPDVIRDVPGILSEFFTFLHQQGYIKNSDRLLATASSNTKDFVNSFPKPKKDSVAKTKPKTSAPAKKTAKKTITETKVGRNNPCPCGSGKKYKKCCGKS